MKIKLFFLILQITRNVLEVTKRNKKKNQAQQMRRNTEIYNLCRTAKVPLTLFSCRKLCLLYLTARTYVYCNLIPTQAGEEI